MEPDIAVVMMTAHGAIQDAVDAMRLGAFDYLLKPFDLEELSLTVEKLVRIQTLAMENLILKDPMATMTDLKTWWVSRRQCCGCSKPLLISPKVMPLY